MSSFDNLVDGITSLTAAAQLEEGPGTVHVMS